MAREVTVHLPDPHGKQREILDSSAKRKVIVTGRRFGKTTLAALVAAERFIRGRRFLYAAPTDDQTTAFWDAINEYFADAIDAKLVYRNKTKRVLEGRLGFGGRIKAKTAWDEDSMRGDHADDLWLDEFAFMDAAVWDKVGAPMLLDTDGDAYFTTTPNRKNHAYVAYMRGLQDDTGRWQSFHGTSFDNPHLSQAALAEIISDLTEDAYEQEILAKFLENEGAVFRNIDRCLYGGGERPEDHEGHLIIAGDDWGKKGDYSACSIVCSPCRMELELLRYRGEDYAMQIQRLGVAWERWNVRRIVAEQNAMGEPILEQLQRAGWPVIGFQTTASSKPPLIEGLALALEKEECFWLDHKVATAELEAYERKVSPTTGRSSYSAPEGVHDDTVMARALAWSGVQRQRQGALVA